MAGEKFHGSLEPSSPYPPGYLPPVTKVAPQWPTADSETTQPNPPEIALETTSPQPTETERFAAAEAALAVLGAEAADQHRQKALQGTEEAQLRNLQLEIAQRAVDDARKQESDEVRRQQEAQKAKRDADYAKRPDVKKDRSRMALEGLLDSLDTFDADHFPAAKATLEELTPEDAFYFGQTVKYWLKRNTAEAAKQKGMGAIRDHSAVAGLGGAALEKTKTPEYDYLDPKNYNGTVKYDPTNPHTKPYTYLDHLTKHAYDEHVKRVAHDAAEAQAATDKAIFYAPDLSEGVQQVGTYQRTAYDTSVSPDKPPSAKAQAEEQMSLLEEISTDPRAINALLESGRVTNQGVRATAENYLSINEAILATNGEPVQAGAGKRRLFIGPRRNTPLPSPEEQRALYEEVYANTHHGRAWDPDFVPAPPVPPLIRTPRPDPHP